MDKDIVINSTKLEYFFFGFTTAGYTAILVYGYLGPIDWLYKWSTLVAGISATIVGCGTIYFLSLQIRQQYEQKVAERLAVNLSDRARLSHPLSLLLDFEQRVIERFRSMLESSGWEHISYSREGLGEVDKTVIDLITLTIVCAEVEAADDLSRLVSLIQIQDSRLGRTSLDGKHVTKDDVPRNTIERYLGDALLIHARAARLLHYARREDLQYFEQSIETSLANAVSLYECYSLPNSFYANLEHRLREDKRFSGLRPGLIVSLN